MNRKALMERVAFVFQNPKLLKASIEENVRGGKKNAAAEDILNALI
jgi:ABC transporter, permease/ATP-binding protein